MDHQAARYVEFMVRMRADRRGYAVLCSLDVIDAKAGGIAGLIGGFSAAATFLLSTARPETALDWAGAGLTGLALLLLAAAGALCATCLFIISHFDRWLIEEKEGLTPQEQVDRASEKLVRVYAARLRRYRYAYLCLLGGILALLPGALLLSLRLL